MIPGIIAGLIKRTTTPSTVYPIFGFYADRYPSVDLLNIGITESTYSSVDLLKFSSPEEEIPFGFYDVLTITTDNTQIPFHAYNVFLIS